MRSLFFLFFLSFSLVSFACYLVCWLSNKLPDALRINVFLVAKAKRTERQSGFVGIVQGLGRSAKRVHKKAAPRNGTTAQLFYLRNQPGGLKLFNSGRHPAWAAATGTARVRWGTAFRIFCWLKVAEFDLLFRFPCFVSHTRSFLC